MVAYLACRAGGNALFILEPLWALEESEVLCRHGDGWIVGELAHVTVPVPLQRVIDARVARLEEEVQNRLAVAAVIGQEVPIALWATITGMDEETSVAVIERATGARLLDATPDGERVRFVHALIREAVYETISPPPACMASSNRRGAGAVAAPRPRSDCVTFPARRGCASVGVAGQSGGHAQQVFARVTAAERYEAAAAAMEEQGVDAGERGWLRYRLATARSYEDTPYAIASLGEAARLAEGTNDRVLLANALGFRGNLRVMYGEVRHGIADMEQSGEIFAALSPPSERGFRHWMFSGFTMRYLIRGALLADLGNAGYYAEALALGARMYADPSGSQVSGRELARIGTVEKGIGLAHAALGRPEEARQAFAREREARQRRGYTPALLAASALNELRYVVLPYQTDGHCRPSTTGGAGRGMVHRRNQYSAASAAAAWPPPPAGAGRSVEEARAVASRSWPVVGMVHSWTMPEANSVCSPVCKASPRSRGAW